MRLIFMPSLKVAGLIAAAGALIFVVFSGLAHGFSVAGSALLALTGAFIGAIGAPEIEPKAFRYPTLWQVSVSVLGFLSGAAYFRASSDGFLLAAALGVIVGYLAPYWVKHVQAP